MRRKVALIIILLLIITISIILIYPKEENKILDTNKESNNNFISVMIEKEAKSSNYQETDNFPDKGYHLNKDLSKCVNGSKISFNEGNIYVKGNKSDLCYVYFDNVQVKSEFEYTGNYEEYVVPSTGTYQIELWGASGGYSLINGAIGNIGGLGAYTTGTIRLNKNEKLYVYVGGAGANGVKGQKSAGGYNGGGLGTPDRGDDEAAGGGGGATDVRLKNGNWNDFDSLKSRIMVAAGGGGRSWSHNVGSGGGLESNDVYATSLNATQTSGNAFGIGKDGVGFGASDGVAGGGGGYYGGKSQDVGYASSGMGGSSYISGHDGCNAIAENSRKDAIVHTDQSIHYSGKVFKNTVMIDGLGYSWTNVIGEKILMPSPDGGTEEGHTGNGYAKITLIS